MKSLLLLCFALLTIASFGQQTITGTISDEDDILPFANIIIKNSTKGVFSDGFGNFSIKAKPSDTLQISFLGYKAKEVVVGEQTNFNILLEDYIELDPVIITAYPICRKEKHIICCGCPTTRPLVALVEDKRSSKVDNVKLFPNPSKDGVFQIKMNDDISEVNILVADLTGRIILNRTHRTFDSNVIIDLSNQPSGVYIMNMSSSGTLIATKKAIRL